MRQAGAAFAALGGAKPDPRIGDAITAHALEANLNNFSTAFERTMIYEIIGLILVSLLTFLLPARPRRREEAAGEFAVAV